MSSGAVPRAWESIISTSGLIPVIVKSLENFFDASWSMEPNIHEHFEMVYVKKGNAVFEIEGSSAQIGPNDIIIIKPFQTHKLKVVSRSGCEFSVLCFRFENRIDKRYSGISLEDFINFVKGRESGAFITLKVNHKNDIVILLDKIVKERKSKELGSDFLSYLLIMELFVHISRALKMEWENSIMNKSPKLKELINAAVKYIQNNFERNISLSDIASYVFLSPGYFTRAFKEVTNETPITFLLKVRVDRAKDLLIETGKKARDIALDVGFSNQQRFNEAFKKYAGMTPLQYRKVKKH